MALADVVGLVGVMLAAQAGDTAETSLAPAPAHCDGTQVARALGLSSRDWQVACFRVDEARRVVAAVPLAPLTPARGKTAPAAPKGQTGDVGEAGPLVVRVALAKGDAVLWRDDIRFGREPTPELRDVLARSDEWLVGIDAQPLGAARGVRVGVVGHWGGDAMSVREIALIFKLPSDGASLKFLWSGLGNTRESRLDYCRIEGMASFHLVDDRTLEREMRVVPNINREARVPRQRARDLEKNCVAKPQPPQRFSLPPG